MNVKIHHNTVTNSGGAIYNTAFSTCTLYNTLIYSNTASNGGAIYNVSNAYVNLINTTITGNNATTKGGAFYCSVSPDGMFAKIYNSIVWGNTSPVNANFFYEFYTRANIHVKNSILQGSGGSAAWNTTYGANDGLNLDANPLFVNPVAEDFTLQLSSPGIDASYNQLLNLPNTNNSWTSADTDVYHHSRLVASGVDIGAAENGSVLGSENFATHTLSCYYSNSNIFFINSEVYQNKAVAIYSMTGEKVFESIITSETLTTPALQSGIYLLKIGTNTATKFVVR